jgi:hypothetical protein
MGLRQMLPVQTKRMRLGFATMKDGEFTDAFATPQHRTSFSAVQRLAPRSNRTNNDRMNRIFLRLLPCLVIVLAAGCSSYSRKFASASRSDVKHLQFEGAYSGKWTSASHPGGGGNLRCILTRVGGSDYRADFHATWHGLSSEHSVVLHTALVTHGKSGAREFSGTSRLHTPIGAGTYMCKGAMDNRTMRACYDATYDRGTFEMSRVVTQDAKR